MTSNRFFKMAAIESEMYYRFQVYWQHLFKKVEIYPRTRLRWDISIHRWDITTSGFVKRTAVILEFYCRFRFRPVHSHQHVILHLPVNFVVIGRSASELWRHIEFSRWRPLSRKTTSGLRFNDGIYLGRPYSICTPNFDEIAQTTVVI